MRLVQGARVRMNGEPLRILIASPIDSGAIDELSAEHDVACAFNLPAEQLGSEIRNRDALVFRSGVQLTANVIGSAPRLKLIVRAGCGLDNIDFKLLATRGIQLVTIPKPAAKAVAEMSLALMLALARDLRNADHLLRRGRWAKHELEGHLLSGKILGIVGAGNIGRRVGQLGAAIGMEPLGCVKQPSSDVADQLLEFGISLTDFDRVVATADFLSIHVPLDDSTRNLINRKALSRMKPGSYLINLARGGVVDEAALYEELVLGQRLRGAALDVHEQEGEGKISPLAALPNVLLTPHIGSMTVETQREIGREVVAAVRSFAANPRRIEEHNFRRDQVQLRTGCAEIL